MNNSGKKELFQFYIKYTAGRVKLFAGTGCISYKDTLFLTNSVQKMGYTAAAVLVPYYYSLSQEKVFTFYDRLATETTENILLYNFPARSGNTISVEIIMKLVAKHSNIIGLKDSVEVPSHTNNIFQVINTSKFHIYSGFDDQFLLNVSNNGNGCIGALSNIVPDIWKELVKAVNEKNFDFTFKLAHLIQKLMPIYDMDSNSALLLKKLMIHRGLNIQETEVFPFDQVPRDTYQMAEKLLDQVLLDFSEIKGKSYL